MEKIQKNSSTGFFGSEPSLLFQILISHTDMFSFFLAEQQTCLGGDGHNRAEPFQRYVEGSRHYLSGPLSWHHIQGMFSPCNSPLRSLYSVRQIALFVIGAAGIWASVFAFSIFWHIFLRIRERHFVGRGRYDRSSWPYDDLQGDFTHRYQRFLY